MVQPDESSSRTLNSLPPRPPTPPRDSQQNANSRPSLFNRIFSKSLGAQTPPNLSPDPAAVAVSSPTERANRRVAWSASTDYKDHDEPPKNPNAINTRLRLIPSSADRQLPPKSILKQNNGDAVNRHIDFRIQPHEHTAETFAAMLESLTKQLAGDDRLSRIDAYMSLSGVLKATDSIPDAEALRNKMGLLAQFIRRDMMATQADGEVDKVLVNNSLSLLASLLWKNEQFPQEFAIFVLEHTITSFENATVPKDVAKHLIFIVGQQNFSPKIVTTDRATRLLNATYMIQEEFKGKSIALGRLSIYKKLLQQAKPVMMANTLWLRHVFEDMLNHDKNVRIPVIAFGLEAASQLGTEKHGSRAFTELFETPYDEKTKYADYYHARLARVLQAKGEHATSEKASVPRIWSVVILFLRYRPAQLDKWEFWASYLHILQKCFNSSDQEVKAQANLAWNRLVFALQPDETTEKRRLNRQLLQPFLGQLHAKRKPTGKPSKEAFQITVSSACNLLYYALRPGASHASLDLLWDLYVPPLIQQLSDTDSSEEEQKSGAPSYEGSNQAIAILHALLNPTPRAKQPWRSDRVMSDERMRFDELSPLDSKWVRANSSRVLAVLQPLLLRRFRDLGAEESRLKDLWKGFLLSIAAAGSKEIITSHETMTCIAHIYTMAHTFWQQRPCHEIIKQEGQSTAFLDGFVYLLTEMVKVLGMLPFGEKKLSIDHLNQFAVVATPSTNSKRTPKAVKSPVQCLIALLVAPGANIESNFALKGALRRLLLPFYEFRAKAKTSLEFCEELFQTLPAPDAEFKRGAVEAIWCVLAKFVETTLESHVETGRYSSSGSSSNGSQLLGVSFRDKVRILEYGLLCLRHDALPEWQSLYRRISWDVVAEAGSGGHALCVAEPLARCLREQYRPEEARSFIALCTTILEESAYPASEQSLEAARRKLWGASSTTPRPSIDPFKHLYLTLNFFLEKSYELEGSCVEVTHVLENIGGFIRHCPDSLKETVLQALGEGLSLWIRDAEDVMHSADSHSSLKDSIEDLWDRIRYAIEENHLGDNDLAKLKTVLSSALSSRHRYIVSSAIELWNTRFGIFDTIEYPDEVAKALACLRSTAANLLLPNFPDIADSDVPPATISFMDSDDSEPMDYASTGGPRGRSVTPSVLGSSPFKARGSPSVNLGLPRSSINHQFLEVPGTGSARKRKIVKPDTTPRLRHDNSQIKFAAIEPSPDPADSQSQLLTDHQREIKERQQEENAAMFADLRSSPKPKAKKAEKKRLSLTSDRPVSQAAEQEQPATPSVTSAVRTLDDWVTSSPTPQNRKQKHVPVEIDLTEVEEEAHVEIPSSPPKAASRSPSPAAKSRTPSPHLKCCRVPAAGFEIDGTKSKPMEVPDLQPPPQADVDSPPSFANLVDHLAAESVTNSSPALPTGSLSFSQLTKGVSKRRRSPVKLSPRASAEDDGDEVIEEAPPIPLSSPTAVEAPAPHPEKDIAVPEKSRKRSRSKSSKSSRKSQEHHPEPVVVIEQPQPAVEEERRRSSSLSELDDSMVKSLEAHHSVDDEGKVRYIALKPDENFSPEQYAKVDVFSSPQKTPEPEVARRETRIVPPSKSASKSRAAGKKSTTPTASEPTSVRTTRGAEKRKSMTPTVETPIATPQRASSRLRQVEPPKVIDLEKVDPSLSKSGGKLGRSQRKAAYTESMKTPAAKAKNAVEVVEETSAVTQTPKRSHKKKVVEPEVVASPSVLETWLRRETPVPVPSRKRKSSAQVEQAEPADSIPIVETVAKLSRNKRRKNDEKKLQPQIVEDSQQDQRMDVEHEGITVPPLSQVSEKPEKSGSSSTYRTARTTNNTSQMSSKENIKPDNGQKKRKRNKKGRGLSAADRSVVESSQQEDQAERAARHRQQQDEAMPDVEAEAEAQSQPGDAEDDAISIVSSHLEIEETEETTTVRYIDRRGQLQREVSKSISQSPTHPPTESQSVTKSELDKPEFYEKFDFTETFNEDSRRRQHETDAQYNARRRNDFARYSKASEARFEKQDPRALENTIRESLKHARTDPDTDMADAEVDAQLRSSIVSNAPAEPGTPARAIANSSANEFVAPQQQRGQSSALWLQSHRPNQEVVPSSSPPAANSAHKRIITSSELGYISSSLSNNEVEHLTPSAKSSSSVSEGHKFTSSPPPQLTQEEQRVLEEAKEMQRQGSRAPSAPPSQLDREAKEQRQKRDEVEDGDVESSDEEGDKSVECEESSSQAEIIQQEPRQAVQNVEQHVEVAVEQAKKHQIAIQEEPEFSSSASSEENEELTYENIQAVFAHGIEMLNRCNNGIRRHHVAKMEEMVFDIKGAMYNAERRSRNAMSDEEKREEFRRRFGDSPPPGEL